MGFCMGRSVRELSDSTDNLIQPFDELVEYFRHSAGQSGADSFNRERAYLTDLYPRFLRQPSDLKLQGQWEGGGLRLAGKSDGNDGAGAFVEYIVTEDQNGPCARLLAPPYRVEVGPANLSP